MSIYKRPHDPRFPVVWLDEFSTPLLRDKREPVAAKPGETAKEDSENLEMAAPPPF